MELTHAEIRAAIYGLAEFRRHRCLNHHPVPREVDDLLGRLETRLRSPAVSRTRHQSGRHTGELDSWVDSRTAAELLGWSQRRAQRRAADLDGQRIGGRLVFPAATVREVAKHQRRTK